MTIAQYAEIARELEAEESEPSAIPIRQERGFYAAGGQYCCNYCHRGFLSVGIKLLHMQRCKERGDAKM